MTTHYWNLCVTTCKINITEMNIGLQQFKRKIKWTVFFQSIFNEVKKKVKEAKKKPMETDEIIELKSEA